MAIFLFRIETVFWVLEVRLVIYILELPLPADVQMVYKIPIEVEMMVTLRDRHHKVSTRM